MTPRNEYALCCVSRCGERSVWLYDIRQSSSAGRQEWHIRAWPQDGTHPDNGGEWYDVALEEIDEASVRLTMAGNHLPKTYHGKGVAPALYPILARRLGRRLLSSRRHVPETNEWRTERATNIWEFLVATGEAERIPSDESYVIEGRAGIAKDTVARPLPTHAAPSNEAEFHAFMSELDEKLQAENAPIAARPLRALGEVSKMLAAEFRVDGSIPRASPQGYEGSDLVARLNRWFDERYGQRLLVDFSPGQVVVQLRGDLWVLKLPMLYGAFTLVARPEALPTKGSISKPFQKGAAAQPLIYDVLDSLLGLPIGLRRDLRPDELDALIFAFHTGFNAYSAMKDVQKVQFVMEARADHDAAVKHLTGGGPLHAGMARWSSLQAAEKMYKAFLVKHGQPVPLTHDLRKLSAVAAAIGLAPADSHLIDLVQCSPGIRYGEVPTSMADAVKAHHASLDLSWYLAEQIMNPGG